MPRAILPTDTLREVDAIVNPLYDTINIPAAGSVLLNFFALPIGQGQSAFNIAGVVKSIADTNMLLAGQLSAGYNFDLLGFRIQPSFNIGVIAAGALVNDATTWSFGAVFTFTVASKIYCQVPVDTIPAGMGVAGFAATTTAATGQSAQSHGVPHISNAFTIGNKALRLSASMSFGATITWPLVITNTSVTPGAAAVTDGIPVRVYLDGYYYRPVQ